MNRRTAITAFVMLAIVGLVATLYLKRGAKGTKQSKPKPMKGDTKMAAKKGAKKAAKKTAKKTAKKGGAKKKAK